jgi:hypothetical protein
LNVSMVRRIKAARIGIFGAALAGTILLSPLSAFAQGLADFDYEDLTLRGLMVDVGYMSASKVDDTQTFGARLDLGFLGPGVRVTAGFNHWSSELNGREVSELEARLEELIFQQTGEVSEVFLGTINWADVALNGDVHFLWSVPFGLLTYAGLGASAHVLRGSGAAIEDTFIDDLLDSVRAGLNGHVGVEVPLHPRFRLVGETRYELLDDLSYLQFRVGGQFMFGPSAAGEG